MPIRSKNLIDSFGHAFAGLGYALRTQPNIRIQAVSTLAVIIIGLWARLDAIQWALISLATGLVWIAELSNTALEAVVDLVSPEYHQIARIAKDVKAATVVIGSLAALMVGIFILLPAVLKRLGI